MSLSSALSIAVSGLTASQTRAQTVAGNIANANTPGYVRRTTILSEVVIGGVGQGVEVVSTERATSPRLTEERMRLEAEYNFASERAGATEALSSLIGEPGAEDGLFGAYARFESALQNAASAPESEILLNQVVESARSITEMFQFLSEEAQKLRAESDQEIAHSVTEVNDVLQRLEEINKLGGASLTPDVLDEQQRLIDTINKNIPVNVSRSGGSLYLTTESGVTLLSAEAATIDFRRAGNMTAESSLGNGLSGLTVDGVDLTPGGGGAQALKGGKISALFETRDERIPAFTEDLDALAVDLVSRFADDSSDPTKPAGAEGLFTTGLATPPSDGDSGIAERISINSLVDPEAGGNLTLLRDGLGATTPGPTGNGEQLERLLDTFTGLRPAPGSLSASGSHSAADLASVLSSDINYQRQLRADDLVYTGTRFDSASNAELAETAVDTDQELQELLLIEQAYAANAKVIETVSQLIDQLIEVS